MRSFDAVRKIALGLPGVVESTSYGTPAFKVGGKLLARLHQDGEAVVVRTDLFVRDVLLRKEPEVFFLTDHYLAYPWVLVRISAVRPKQLAGVLEEGVRLLAGEASKPKARQRRRTRALK